MHKTVTITIGGQLFHVEEAAYQKLDEYLQSIRAHFASYPENDEIVSDIEDRIAEEFQGTMNARKKVIMHKDVDLVIKKMGTVEDFEAFDSSSGAKAQAAPSDQGFAGKKWGRLYRDADDQMLGGVCAGIAKFVGIDPSIVRLLFGLSIFMGGAGFVLYILLWIILPEAKTTSEKVEMTRGKVTLNAIRERVEAAIPSVKKRRGTIQKVLSTPFIVVGVILRGLGKVLRVLIPILGRIIGAVIAIGAAFAIAAATFALLTLLLNSASSYIDFPLREVMGATNYSVIIVSVYFLAFIPLLFILLIGVSLITMKNTFTAWGVAGMIGVWMIALVIGSAVGVSVAPTVETAVRQYEAEHFKQIEKTLNLAEFTKIEVASSDVVVTKANRFSVTLSGSESDVTDADVRVSDGTLQMDRHYGRQRCLFLCRSHRVRLTIAMPTLEYVTLRGSAKGQISGFSGGTLIVDLLGTSFVDASVAPDTLDITMVGSSHMEVRGSAQSLKAMLNGASSLGAYTFPVQTAEVFASGASRAMIDASQKISGELHGASQLWYQREPPTLDIIGYGTSQMGRRDEDIRERW